MKAANDNTFHPEVAAAIARMQDAGEDAETIAHALVSAGLYHLAGNFCSEHLAEHLDYVHGWIGERIADTRREMNERR